MEEVAEHVKIIEFNGLPGAGKTTIASCLKEIAEFNNWRVVYSFCQNQKLFTLLFNPTCLSFLPLVSKLNNKWWYKKEVLGQTIRFLNYVRSYKGFIKKHPVTTLYVLDEGIVQSIVSILFIDSIEGKQNIIRNIFQKLYKNGITWYQVNIENDIQLSYNRVLERKSNLGRMDCMKGEILMTSLTIQNDSFSQIRALAADTGVAWNSLTVFPKEKVEFSAKKIFEWIKS